MSPKVWRTERSNQSAGERSDAFAQPISSRHPTGLIPDWAARIAIAGPRL